METLIISVHNYNYVADQSSKIYYKYAWMNSFDADRLTFEGGKCLGITLLQCKLDTSSAQYLTQP